MTKTSLPQPSTPRSTLDARIHQALIANPHLSGRKLRIENDAGTVTLQGRVDTFFQKQMAQEALRHVDGVEQVDNLLEVTWR